MESIFNKICVLVTAAFALTLVPGFRRSESSLLSVSDRGTALLVFMLLGLAEQVAVGRSGWYNHRIVAACSAGLLAGPGVGAVVAAFVTWLAVAYDGRPLVICGFAMLSGALASRRLAVSVAPQACATSPDRILLNRDNLVLARRLDLPMQSRYGTGDAYFYPTRNGSSAARARHSLDTGCCGLDTRSRSANCGSGLGRGARSSVAHEPAFLVLNTFATLATIAPREIPRAAGQLRHFLRASFDQSDRTLIPLEEELTVVRAYLDIESLRLVNGLILELAIESGLTEALVPPFSLQSLVENAMQHSLQCWRKTRCLSLVVCRRIEEWLDVIVSDDGEGPSTQSDQICFVERLSDHALTLLRRRLRGLYGRSFKLAVRSKMGGGTTVTMRIPLRVITLCTRPSLSSAEASPVPRSNGPC